jgi:hypothetical protein
MENLVAIANLRHASASRTHLLHQVNTPALRINPDRKMLHGLRASESGYCSRGLLGMNTQDLFPNNPRSFGKNSGSISNSPVIFWREIQDLFANSGGSFWQISIPTCAHSLRGLHAVKDHRLILVAEQQ